MRETLYVAMGGAIGAVTRYGAGLGADKLLGKGFPWGRLTVNVVGCFVMGIVLEVLAGLETPQRTPAGAMQVVFWRQGIAIGFLGGLTTFSSFGADTLRQFQAGQSGLAIANIAANVVLSLA